VVGDGSGDGGGGGGFKSIRITFVWRRGQDWMHALIFCLHSTLELDNKDPIPPLARPEPE